MFKNINIWIPAFAGMTGGAGIRRLLAGYGTSYINIHKEIWKYKSFEPLVKLLENCHPDPDKSGEGSPFD